MIVNYTPEGWEIITQRAHGLLAAQIASYWKFTYPPNRRLDTILAIAEHDDTGIEFSQQDLLTPAGGPVHYAMRGFDAGHCRQLMLASRAKSRYFTLLNAMHLTFLYEKDTSDAARTFIREQRQLVSRLRRELGVSAAQANKTYALMQWCDALSLLICQHAVQPEHRMTEISKGPEGISYELCQLSADSLSVRPWPFVEPQFTVSIEFRTLSQLQFTSTADFQRALEEASIKEKVYTLKVHGSKERGRTGPSKKIKY
jgi:hypothetical protein